MAIVAGNSDFRLRSLMESVLRHAAAVTGVSGQHYELRTPEDVVREILHEGDAAVHVPAQVVVDLSGYEKASVCRDVAVLQYNVARMV